VNRRRRSWSVIRGKQGAKIVVDAGNIGKGDSKAGETVLTNVSGQTEGLSGLDDGLDFVEELTACFMELFDHIAQGFDVGGGGRHGVAD
jgi:hypothetical protein